MPSRQKRTIHGNVAGRARGDSCSAHTPADRPELVDPAIVVDVTRFMADVIAGVDASE